MKGGDKYKVTQSPETRQSVALIGTLLENKVKVITGALPKETPLLHAACC